MNLTMFHTKLVVHTYTALTLPFYAMYQRPWQKVKQSDTVYATSTVHEDRVTWRRNGPKGHFPTLKCSTYLEAFKLLDPSQKSVGYRNIINEKVEVDEEGPIIIDGKVLKKLVLSDTYNWMTAGEVLERVENIAKALHDLGVRKGDKIIIYDDAHVNWFFCSMAVAQVGAVVATLYPNLGSAGVTYGINQTKARYVITSEELKNKMLTKFIKDVPRIKNIIYFPRPTLSELEKDVDIPEHDVNLIPFDKFIEKGSKLPPIQFDLPKPDDLALIMYTSGTTSLPKAVMINHRMLMSNIKSMTMIAVDNRFNFEDTTVASFLPMSHIFGFVFNTFMFINGAKIGFATPQTMLDNSPANVPGQVGDFKLIKPTIFVAVPLVLERFQKAIYAQLNNRGYLAAPLFTFFIDYKTRWMARGFETPIIDKFLCAKIRNLFGSNLIYIGIGGAALHESIQKFTKSALNVKVFNAFGCTETTGGVYICNPDDLFFGVCGTPMDQVLAQLVDWPEGGYCTSDKPNPRGELLIGGEMVAGGYLDMDEETKEAFHTDENGVRWFHTGDIGEIDPVFGRLRIIDRKKDVTKLANGEFVSLGKIETGLRSSRYVENICVCNNMFSNHLVAIVSPNRRVVKELAKSINKAHLSHEERCEDEEIQTIVHASLKETGKKAGLKAKEIPVKIKLVSQEWTPENNLLTAAFKLKRKEVYKTYDHSIRQMFSSVK